MSNSNSIISDDKVLRFVVDTCGSRKAAAVELGLESGNSITNWRARGIPPNARMVIWAWCRSHGLQLTDGWLLQSTANHERQFNGGSDHGRTGAGKQGKARAQAQGKRQSNGRPQQRQRRARRRAAGSDRQVAA